MPFNMGGLEFEITSNFLFHVSMGHVKNFSAIDKFGEAGTITTATDPMDVWEGLRLYTYDTNGTAPIARIVSTASGDDQYVAIQGLDINGNLVEQYVTLTGTTPVLLTTPLWRIFRIYNEDDTDFTGTIYAYIDEVIPTAVTDSQVRALVTVGHNQTLMALYTIPKGYVGFLIKGEIGMSRSVTAAIARCAYYSRRYGKVFRVKKRIDVTNSGSSIYQDLRAIPDPIPALTDIRLTVEEVSATIGVAGAFDILLVKECEFTETYLTAIGQPT